jgi:hypothetical protein
VRLSVVSSGVSRVLFRRLSHIMGLPNATLSEYLTAMSVAVSLLNSSDSESASELITSDICRLCESFGLGENAMMPRYRRELSGSPDRRW